MLYTAIKLVHILFAITAVGLNISYAIWIARVARQPREVQGHVLRGVKFLDDRVANPAYGLLLLSGLAMVFVGPWSLTTRWIDGALILYVVAVLLAALGYTPALKRQIQALDAQGHESGEYSAAANRQQLFGIAVAIPILLILFLMVFKPSV